MNLIQNGPWTTCPNDSAAAGTLNGEECCTPNPCVRLAWGGTVFLLITASIFLYQFFLAEVDEQASIRGGLRFDYLGLLLLCLPLDTLAAGLRIWLVCRVLRPATGFWICLQAEWANSGIALLTPMQTGGGLGQIYMLQRGGLAIATATTISLITFFGTTLGLLFIGLYSVLFSDVTLGPFFSAAAWSLTTILVLMSAALVRPNWVRALIFRLLETLRKFSGRVGRGKRRSGEAPAALPYRIEWTAARLVDLVYDYHHGMGKFIRTGKVCFVGVVLLSLIFILARCLMAFLCLRFLGIPDSTLGEVLEIQLALLFLLYLAPTPGGSGLAEAFSLSAMAGIIPTGLAPYYHLLWRTTTLYLPAGLGLLLLARALFRDTRTVVGRRIPRKTPGPIRAGQAG